MLEENYRSHPSLIHLPSKLFYGNALKACANVAERESLCQFPSLVVKVSNLVSSACDT
jgi:superfamily I DNA and/or RNA helicase